MPGKAEIRSVNTAIAEEGSRKRKPGATCRYRIAGYNQVHCWRELPEKQGRLAASAPSRRANRS